jgi:hypothetical protein
LEGGVLGIVFFHEHAVSGSVGRCYCCTCDASIMMIERDLSRS